MITCRRNQAKADPTRLKPRFEPDLHLQVMEAVCHLFRGQEMSRTDFTLTRNRTDRQERLALTQDDLGIENRLTLLDNEILANQ